MAFRLCLAFCLLCAAAVSMVRSVGEARLRSRLLSESWVARANAAVLLSENPRAAGWLVDSATDEAPPVRSNVLWALNRLTGAPWASQTMECLSWWAATKGLQDFKVWSGDHRAELALSDSSRECEIRADLRWVDDSLQASISNRGTSALTLHRIPWENYAAFLYGPGGRVVRKLDEPEPESGTAVTLLFDEQGHCLATWWWRIDGETMAAASHDNIDPASCITETYELGSLPPGRYVAELRVGALGLDLASREREPEPDLVITQPAPIMFVPIGQLRAVATSTVTR